LVSQKLHQLEDNLKAVEVVFTTDELEQLDVSNYPLNILKMFLK
jgi:aryl-alcohol dehydrogenase-like predicted oxidoreductase